MAPRIEQSTTTEEGLQFIDKHNWQVM